MKRWPWPWYQSTAEVMSNRSACDSSAPSDKQPSYGIICMTRARRLTESRDLPLTAPPLRGVESFSGGWHLTLWEGNWDAGKDEAIQIAWTQHKNSWRAQNCDQPEMNGSTGHFSFYFFFLMLKCSQNIAPTKSFWNELNLMIFGGKWKNPRTQGAGVSRLTDATFITHTHTHAPVGNWSYRPRWNIHIFRCWTQRYET